jgi:uncharacterized protein with FMN-binding domain
MARKLNKNLLAIGSAAIVSIYAVGFARTATTPPASAGNDPIAASPALAASATQAPPADAATAIAQAIAAASATPSAATPTAAPVATTVATAASAASTGAYKDGTYSGTGSSRLGDITVAVTVQGGQIAAVRITGSTTHYPTSRISQLPGEVVAAQSTNIKLVSGATYSSQAFKQAVTQALAQAATGA